MKTDILLLYPPGPKLSYQMSLPYLAGRLVKEGYSVKVIDPTAVGMQVKEICARARRMKPLMIGLSIPYTPYAPAGIRLLRMLKKAVPKAFIVAGGVHPTLMPEEVAVHCDAVVIGEGEETLVDLLSRKKANKGWKSIKGLAYMQKGKLKRTECRPAADIDEIPFPAWHLLPVEKYELKMEFSNRDAMPIQASRGCPYNCNFCSNGLLSDRRVRFRSVDNVMAEIKHYIKRYNVRSFVFRDEVFTLRKDRVFELCRRLKEETPGIVWCANARADTVDADKLAAMRDAGCKEISIGIETGDPRIIKEINKGLTLDQIRDAVKLIKRSGINVAGTMIIGHLGDTPESVKRSIEFVNELDLDYTGFAIATPYPATGLRIDAEKMGLEMEKDWSRYYTYEVTYVPPGLKGYDLTKIRIMADLHYFSRNLNRIWRLFKTRKLWFLVNLPGIVSEYIRAKLNRPIDLKNIPSWYLWYHR